MLTIERSLMWTHVSITGVNIDYPFASGIASALGMVTRADAETADLDPACKFQFDLLDSNGEYSGAFSFDAYLHKRPTLSIYIDFNSEQELKFNALGGESWLQNLIVSHYHLHLLELNKMLKIERLPMWTYIQIVGAGYKLASGIAAALGLTMREGVEMVENDPACQFNYDLLDSNDEYSGSFSFDTDLHKRPILSLYIDFNSEQELKYNALGGESWLQNLLKERD